MTAEETLALAHREAWRYRKSSDPHHSDTYTFNRATLLEFARKLSAAEREACAKVCEITSNHPSSLWWEPGCWKHAAQNCADAIRERSNVKVTRLRRRRVRRSAAERKLTEVLCNGGDDAKD